MKALRGLEKFSGGWWWWWWSKSDYSVCPRPFLRPVQDWVWDINRDRTGTGLGRWDGTGRDGELNKNSFLLRDKFGKTIQKYQTTAMKIKQSIVCM